MTGSTTGARPERRIELMPATAIRSDRVSGAGAFVNAARSVLVLARDPGDPGGEQRAERVLVDVASNWGRYAPTLVWRVEARDVTVDDGSTSDACYLVAQGETSLGAEDLRRGPDENRTDAEEATSWKNELAKQRPQVVETIAIEYLGSKSSTDGRRTFESYRVVVGRPARAFDWNTLDDADTAVPASALPTSEGHTEDGPFDPETGDQTATLALELRRRDELEAALRRAGVSTVGELPEEDLTDAAIQLAWTLPLTHLVAFAAKGWIESGRSDDARVQEGA